MLPARVPRPPKPFTYARSLGLKRRHRLPSSPVLTRQVSLKTKHFLALFRKKSQRLLVKLMLSGGGTFSPLRCRC